MCNANNLYEPTMKEKLQKVHKDMLRDKALLTLGEKEIEYFCKESKKIVENRMKEDLTKLVYWNTVQQMRDLRDVADKMNRKRLVDLRIGDVNFQKKL